MHKMQCDHTFCVVAIQILKILWTQHVHAFKRASNVHAYMSIFDLKNVGKDLSRCVTCQVNEYLLNSHLIHNIKEHFHAGVCFKLLQVQPKLLQLRCMPVQQLRQSMGLVPMDFHQALPHVILDDVHQPELSK